MLIIKSSHLKLPWITGLVFKRTLRDNSQVPRVQFDRNHRKHAVWDYGYFYNFYQQGQSLPRLKGKYAMAEARGKLNQKHMEDVRAKDPWKDKQTALLGVNDYIDLLGNGKVHPAQLLYHCPRWLRGFPGNHKAIELVRLIHYRNLYKEKMQRNSPKRWHDLMKRINFLLHYHNYKKQDELRDERSLRLWDEEPDYFYKDKELRSYKDMH